MGIKELSVRYAAVKSGLLLATSLLAACLLTAGAQAQQPRLNISTSMGDIVVELSADKAPLSVANFLKYVDDGSYVGTIFHRVIPDFMIQGGGHRPDLSEVEDAGLITNEADNGLRNVVGTLAYARNNEIDSASRQFFINVSDNTNLDHSSESCSREDENSRLAALERGLNKPQTCSTFGYAVFGHVVAGMAVVMAIKDVPTGYQGEMADVPDTPIIIQAITRLPAKTVVVK